MHKLLDIRGELFIARCNRNANSKSSTSLFSLTTPLLATISNAFLATSAAFLSSNAFLTAKSLALTAASTFSCTTQLASSKLLPKTLPLFLLLSLQTPPLLLATELGTQQSIQTEKSPPPSQLEYDQGVTALRFAKQDL
jgi:hypothetical protein